MVGLPAPPDTRQHPSRISRRAERLPSVMTTHSFQSRSRRADSHGPAPRVQRLGVASSLI